MTAMEYDYDSEDRVLSQVLPTLGLQLLDSVRKQHDEWPLLKTRVSSTMSQPAYNIFTAL